MAISLQSDPSLQQGYIKVNGTTAATISPQGLSAQNLFNYVNQAVASKAFVETLVNVKFNHLTNPGSIIAAGVNPVQASFFPDDRGAGQPTFRIANNAGIGKHWITISFTPNKANRIFGEVSFPIRVANYSGTGAEDETTIYIFNVTTQTPTVVTQQCLFNGTIPSTGFQVRAPFNMYVTPGMTHTLLVSTMTGYQGNRTDTDIFTSYTGYQMNFAGITGNRFYTSDNDQRIINLTAGRFANCEVLVYGFYEG